MEIQSSTLSSDIRLIKLSGRFDIIGTGQIETKFAGYCSGDKVHVIVDLAGVDFLASIGIRLLVLTAKSVAHRGGRMVILNPTPDVHHILDLAGIMSIIPVYSSLESAQAVAGAH
jgi:anti-sigma B factor antagonist